MTTIKMDSERWEAVKNQIPVFSTIENAESEFVGHIHSYTIDRNGDDWELRVWNHNGIARSYVSRFPEYSDAEDYVDKKFVALYQNYEQFWHSERFAASFDEISSALENYAQIFPDPAYFPNDEIYFYNYLKKHIIEWDYAQKTWVLTRFQGGFGYWSNGKKLLKNEDSIKFDSYLDAEKFVINEFVKIVESGDTAIIFSMSNDNK